MSQAARPHLPLVVLLPPWHPEGKISKPFGDLSARLQAEGHPVQVLPCRAGPLSDMARAVHAYLASQTEVFHVVAHGVGARVFQEWAHTNGDLWRDRVWKGSRAVLLAPPTRGAWAFLRPYLRLHGLCGGDVAARGEAVLSLVGDLVPTRLRDLSAGGNLPGEPPPPVPPRDRLLPGVFTVLGFAHPTEANPYLSLEGSGEAREGEDPVQARAPGSPMVRVRLEPGDGVVALADASIEEAPTWYTRASHSGMPSEPAVVTAILDLLHRDTTSALPAGWARPPDDVARSVEVYGPDWSSLPDPLAVPLHEAAPGAACSLEVGVICGAPEGPRHALVVGLLQVGDQAILPTGLPPRILKRLREEIHAEDAASICAEGTVIGITGEPFLVVVGIQRGAGWRSSIQDALGRVVHGCRTAGALPGGRIHGTLLGVHEGLLPVAESVSAQVEGVVLGNRAQADQPPVDTFLFHEPWEDVAAAAARAVSRIGAIVRTPLKGTEHLHPRPTMEESPNPRSLADPHLLGPQTWQRLGIRQKPPRRMEFAWDSHQSYEEVFVAARGDQDLDPLFTAIAQSKGRESKRVHWFFEAAVPQEVRDQWVHQEDVLLVVDEDTAKVPWEALPTGREGRWGHAGVEMGLVRRLAVEDVKAVADPPGRTAVVIGVTGGSRPIPSAFDEAWEVATLLHQGGFSPDLHIDKDWQCALSAALSGARVLHVAAHGYRGGGGIGLGPDFQLTAADFADSAVIPSLVFLNACHQAELLPRDPYSHAEPTLVQALIRKGARALVVSAFLVPDQAARTFASVFYRSLLQGRTFGRAVHLARVATFARFSDGTCTLWQAYGDPEFRLVEPHAPFVACLDLVHHIRQAEARAHGGGARPSAQVQMTLREVEDRLTWQPAFRQARVWEALADAWSALGDRERATRFYGDAVRCERGPVSVHAIEQMLNLEDRKISREWEYARPEDRTARLEDHARVLDRLHALIAAAGPTVERLSILAGGYKRRTFLRHSTSSSPCPDRIRADLVACADRYGAARALAVKRGEPEYYPALNEVTLRWMASPQHPGLLEDLQDLARRSALGATALDDAWLPIHVADARGLLWLFTEQPGSPEALLAEYQAIFDRRSSAGTWSSVRDQYAYIADMLRLLEGETPRQLRVRQILEGMPR